MQIKSAQELQELATAIFKAAGATAENAEGVVSSLISANLAGHDSHGVMRIPSYVEDIHNGRIRPAAAPFVTRERPAAAIIDCAATFGQLGARLTAETAVRKTREAGMGGAALFRANHTGRIGEWAELGASQGMITLVTASGPFVRLVAPFGGRDRSLGTNPIAWAVPRPGGRPPILLDFATSAAAQGKLMVARAKHETVPPGWILDAEGRSTTDVEDYFGGGVLLPFAGHKGYALSVIVELMAVGLSGGDAVPKTERGSCLFVACFDPGAFRPEELFGESVERVAGRLKAVKPAAGFDEVLLPGEPEARAREERLRQGIPLPDDTWKAICRVANDLAIAAG
ncbi:MAG: Ldh family oxidoreductase [Deltaproteobacteria bacterium]|nr:Ldh family oxidoreductase [Deltaproteobacteria bacterium]